MISAWNLLWIIPMTSLVSVFCTALVAVNRKEG